MPQPNERSDDRTTGMSEAEFRAEKVARMAFKAGRYPFETCGDCEAHVVEQLKLVYWEDFAFGTDEAMADFSSKRAKVYAWLLEHRNASGHEPI